MAKRENTWQLAYKNRNLETSIIEPVHRVPPNGVTAGTSFRELPKSCIEQVRDICLFYVGKCSGKYQNNVAAARYVHQMASEVINQLSGVAEDMKRNIDEPEMYKKLLDEWNQSFPPSLGDYGSPKAIAAKLVSQAKEIEDLGAKLEVERKKHESDVSGVTRSVDAQLEASRKGVMGERRQLALKSQRIIDGLNIRLKALEKQKTEELESMREQHSQEIYMIEVKHQKDSAELRSKLENIELISQKREEEIVNLFNNNKAAHQRQKSVLFDRLKKLQDKYQKLKEKLVYQLNDGEDKTHTPLRSRRGSIDLLLQEEIAPLDLSSFEEEEEIALPSFESQLQQVAEGKKLESLFQPVKKKEYSPLVNSPTVTPAKRTSFTQPTPGTQNVDASPNPSAPVTADGAVRRMSFSGAPVATHTQNHVVVFDTNSDTKIKRLEKALDEAEAEIEQQRTHVKDLLEALGVETSRLTTLKLENDSLHKALVELVPRLNEDRKTGRVVSAQPKPMQHTPDFLKHTRSFNLHQ